MLAFVSPSLQALGRFSDMICDDAVHDTMTKSEGGWPCPMTLLEVLMYN